jgi:L-iditol 2-dehydrogenase
VLAHEFSGVVEELGAGVSGYSVGQRVSVAPNIGCGACDRCISGNSHHCKGLAALGIHLDGGFAEYARIPADAVRMGNAVPIGRGVSFEAAAVNEAFSCVYSAFERYRVNPGDTVVIVGAGAIGLMHAKLAKIAGASTIILNDLSEERLRECSAIEPGVVAVRENLLEMVSEATGGEMADVVITACSAAAAQKEAFKLAGLDGRVNFFGGLAKGNEMVELDTNLIHYRQLSVTGTTRASLRQYRQTLKLISAGIVDIEPLITHRWSLSDIHTAVSNAASAIGLKQAVVFG